jgi:hypothetical protein
MSGTIEPAPALFPPLTGIGTDVGTPGVTGQNGAGSGLGGGTGVFGVGNAFGVMGEVPDGLGGETQPIFPAGVLGKGGNNGDGVVGNSINHDGVVGDSVNGEGVRGTSHSPNTDVAGVVGVNTNPGGLAGKFFGNVEVAGNININSGGDIFLADCAEEFDIRPELTAEPGTVVVFSHDGMVEPTDQAYDKRVAGVISGAGDYSPAIVLDRRRSHGPRVSVALLGKVYCKVDARYASVDVGDLLTTSPTSGHAMKACDPFKAFGAVIGKALGSLVSGQGVIPILVALQ